MPKLKKCFGIPSWLPEKEPDRSLRIERVNRLFSQLSELWPDIDILVIAQNWKNFVPVETKNKQIIKKYPELGILGARKKLREEFLALDYDYIIMFDDDAIIKCDNDKASAEYMAEIDKHPNGFCFIMPSGGLRAGVPKYHPYIGAQLNLCAISRFIYEQEPMVDIDPQKKEGYEDSIYACLLHHKWEKYEFLAPKTIRPIQFMNPNEKAPSTWVSKARSTGNLSYMSKNTHKIQEYIVKNKKFPAHYKNMIERPRPDLGRNGDGSEKGAYLYF